MFNTASDQQLNRQLNNFPVLATLLSVLVDPDCTSSFLPPSKARIGNHFFQISQAIVPWQSLAMCYVNGELHVARRRVFKGNLVIYIYIYVRSFLLLVATSSNGLDPSSDGLQPRSVRSQRAALATSSFGSKAPHEVFALLCGTPIVTFPAFIPRLYQSQVSWFLEEIGHGEHTEIDRDISVRSSSYIVTRSEFFVNDFLKCSHRLYLFGRMSEEVSVLVWSAPLTP